MNGHSHCGSHIDEKASLFARLASSDVAAHPGLNETGIASLAQIPQGGNQRVQFLAGVVKRQRGAQRTLQAKSDKIGLALEEERLPKRIEIRPRRINKAQQALTEQGRKWTSKSSST